MLYTYIRGTPSAKLSKESDSLFPGEDYIVSYCGLYCNKYPLLLFQVKKPTAEVFSSGAAGVAGSPGALDAVRRVAQLEQNIRFLQEQHALLLTGLHREIDAQRQMNRGNLYCGTTDIRFINTPLFKATDPTRVVPITA